MASPFRVVSFDCAQTLVEVDWVPPVVALKCARKVGLALDEQVAAETYSRLIGSRWAHYGLLNQRRDPKVLEDFWLTLSEDWLKQLGEDIALAPELIRVSDEVFFGTPSEVYRLYEDVIPTLQGLKERDYPLIVISNWDASLHRVLNHFGLSGFFNFALASLEEGAEKPDPKLFRVALDRLGLPPGEILHIGDNPIDDVQGARALGMGTLLIDRGAEPGPGRINDLRQVLEFVG
ncbi:MAG: HAD-IA family hydrolase [Fimbriimonadaceae bacterium]|nr:HAD-IA family hydrolase [Fimbriimonadaceae bacterium]